MVVSSDIMAYLKESGGCWTMDEKITYRGGHQDSLSNLWGAGFRREHKNPKEKTKLLPKSIQIADPKLYRVG